MGKIYGIGLMSGTSLDGIDGALVEISENNYQIIETISVNYTEEERRQLFNLCSIEKATNKMICSMNMYLGEKFAKTVNDLLKNSQFKAEDISFISSHGQTIYHIPKSNDNKYTVVSTLQIGDLSMIAEKTGIGVVGDFRTADMAAGGQGAPLTSFADKVLFYHETKYRAIQNIGGIGNVTYLPAKQSNENIIAFDTGPGNMMIDELVLRMSKGGQSYDENGNIARKGTVDDLLLNELMAEEYIRESPPKTTGREVFGKNFVDKLLQKYNHLSFEDLICTVTEFTAQSISFHYKKYLKQIDEVIIGGGGSYNGYLIERIQSNLKDVQVFTHEDFNVSSDFKEALAFVILGHYFLKGETNMIPTATGAKHDVLLGKIGVTNSNAFEKMLKVKEG